MKIDDFDRNHFGVFCEGLVLTYLPNRPIWCSKQFSHSYIDIDWLNITIEVKGNRNKKGLEHSYHFPLGHEFQRISDNSNPNGPYKSVPIKYSKENKIKNKYTKIIVPDIYIFVGFYKDNCTFWIINTKKFIRKSVIGIKYDDKFWNKYKIENPRDIPYKICEEVGKIWNSSRLVII